jgi:hypothetical protein
MRASCRIRAAVVTAGGADYHSRMPKAASRTFQVVERSGPGQRTVLRRDGGGSQDLIVVSGFRGPDLPDAIAEPRLLPQGPASWRLTSEGGTVDFTARAVDAIEVRPELYAQLHRPFALGAGERLAARVLLALLRLPGGAGLLRRWHARRGS